MRRCRDEGDGEVIYVHDPGFSSEMRLNPEPMRSAIEALIKELTGESSPSGAWRTMLNMWAVKNGTGGERWRK